MNSSTERVNRSINVSSFFIITIVLYITGLFISHLMTARELVYWSGHSLEVQDDKGQWIASNRMNISSSTRTQVVRFSININESEIWKQPISIKLGGPFSAQIYWNNEVIGNKGVVGDSSSDEIAGPIDFSALIPSRLLQNGENKIELRLSTMHLRTNDNSVLHYVWVTPYQKDGQRAMRYYAIPLVICSGLLMLSFQSFRIGRSAGNILHSGLGIYGFLIVISLIAEVSRGAINYSYEYHELRSAVGWFAIVGAGLCLTFTTYRMTGTRFSKFILALGFMLALVTILLPMRSEDSQLAWIFIMLIAGPSVMFTASLLKRQISYFCTVPLFCLANLTSILFSVELFLDSFLFIASIILIGGAWLWTNVNVNLQVVNKPINNAVNILTIKTSGEDRIVSLVDCYALKADGNYTVIMQTNGVEHLHQDGIGAILETLPAHFVRVHRSFAININEIMSLKSSTGSKYFAQMRNKKQIPVSRYRVAELRNLLKVNSQH